MLRFLVLLFLVGCGELSYPTNNSSLELESVYQKNDYKFIDFSTLQGENWTKVCFLGPYNTQSSKALGFKWDVSEYTDVLASDAHNVIIFSTESNVLSYIILKRRSADFWRLTGQCFPRKNSVLYKDKESGAWSVG